MRFVFESAAHSDIALVFGAPSGKGEQDAVGILAILHRANDDILPFLLRQPPNHHDAKQSVVGSIDTLLFGLDKIVVYAIGYDMHLGIVALSRERARDK